MFLFFVIHMPATPGIYTYCPPLDIPAAFRVVGLRHARGRARQERASGPPDPGGLGLLAREASYELAASITSFLVDNDLDVSPTNLLLAHGAFSGRNPRLARQILAQAQTAEGISQKWLNELADQNRKSTRLNSSH